MKVFKVPSHMWGSEFKNDSRLWEIQLRKNHLYAILDRDELGEYFRFTNQRALIKFVGQLRCGDLIIRKDGKMFYCDGEKLEGVNNV